MRAKKRLPTNRRIFERVLVMLLIAVIIAALMEWARDVRGRAELGAFQYSLGALRVALVLGHLHAVTRADPPRSPPNPFTLLDRPLTNYVGELAVADALTGALPSGSWFYDAQCPCLGYRPLDERRLVAVSGGGVLVFDMRSSSDTSTAPGSAMLLPRESYFWWGTPIR